MKKTRNTCSLSGGEVLDERMYRRETGIMSVIRDGKVM
jgi:hypothetical protein